MGKANKITKCRVLRVEPVDEITFDVLSTLDNRSARHMTRIYMCFSLFWFEIVKEINDKR
jgi:hypothetical protein